MTKPKLVPGELLEDIAVAKGQLVLVLGRIGHHITLMWIDGPSMFDVREWDYETCIDRFNLISGAK